MEYMRNLLANRWDGSRRMFSAAKVWIKLGIWTETWRQRGRSTVSLSAFPDWRLQ